MAASEDCDVGILVLREHQNYFVNLCRMLADHGGRVIIFTRSEYRADVREWLDERCFEWSLKSADESDRKYLARIEAACNEDLDLLLAFPLPGMRSVLDSLRFDPGCRTVQMVYNANLWSMSRPHFTTRLYKYIELPLRRLLLSDMDAVLVEYSPIQEYLQDDVATDVHAFTPIVFEEVPDTNEGDDLVVVPGHVDTRRRDYATFLDAVESDLTDRQDELEVKLLGRPVGDGGEQIARRCDDLAERGWNVDYFSEWIPVAEFERQLQRSSVVVSPMRRTKRVPPVTERYGRTKASGCFGDAIRYGRPLVLPDHYSVPEEVAAIVRQYETRSGLGDLMEEILDGEGLSPAARDELAERYSFERQRSRLYSIFESVLDDSQN